ncbi:hypothetical protein ABPG74_003637 [Tetrahymena malaccensis]
MGCCESKKGVVVGLKDDNLCKIKNMKSNLPLILSEYKYQELNRELDFQVVCITKPDLSYIIRIDNTQLETWTLYNLEVKIIEDLKDYMIESFRFAQMKDIQKSFYSQKMIQFMDLLPIYIELSVDETMEYIQIEIPHSNHVINIPYDNNTTIKSIKKKICQQFQFQDKHFELLHQGEALVIDDMSLQDCKIQPGSKIIVQEFSNQNAPLPLHVLINNKRYSSNLELPAMIKRMGTLEISQDLTINNITKIQTKIMEEDQTQEILDNFEVISTKSQDFHNMHKEGSAKCLLKLESKQLLFSQKKISSKKNISNQEILIKETKQYDIFQVSQGANILTECVNSLCSQYKIKQMLQLNFGEFIINAQDQELLLQCISCQKTVQIDELLFYKCSYIVSGIYKLKNTEDKSQQIYKQNDCQYINTKGDNIERYDFQPQDKEWKSIRLRACKHKKNKIWCCFCTKNINQQRDNSIKLTCHHTYHEACIQKLKALDSTCVMCVF